MVGSAVAMTEVSRFCRNSGMATTMGMILSRAAMARF